MVLHPTVRLCHAAADVSLLVIQPMRLPAPAQAKPLFEMMRNAAIEEIKAAQESYNALTQEK